MVDADTVFNSPTAPSTAAARLRERWRDALKKGYRALPEDWQPPAREVYDATLLNASVALKRRALFASERILFLDHEIADVVSYKALGPGPGEVLVETHYTAVSVGTEMAVYLGLMAKAFPHWPGYSGAGIVERVGPGVRDIKPGDRVAGQLKHAARYVASERQLFKLAPTAPLQEAAFHHLCFISLGGVRKARLRPGMSIAVVGQGIVGQLATRFARIAGATPVVAVATSARRRAQSLAPGGADTFLLVDEAPRDSFDVVIEASGACGSIALASDLARVGGTVVLLGGYRYPERAFDAERLWRRKRLETVGAHMTVGPDGPAGSRVRPYRSEGELIVELLDDRTLDLGPLVTHSAQPKDVNRLYEDLGTASISAVGVTIAWRDGAGSLP